MRKGKRAPFYQEIKSIDGKSHWKVVDVTDSSSSEEKSPASVDSLSEDHSLEAESSSSEDSSSEEQSLAAVDWSAAEPESEEEESLEEESEERSDKETGMERGPAYNVIELSSGDEDPLPSKKIYGGPSSRTRSKNPRKTPMSHVAEPSRKQETEKKKTEKKKMEKLVQPRNLQPKRKRSDNAAEETSRRREKKAKGREANNLRWSDDRVAEDVHCSDMLSCTGRSSQEEEVQGEVVSEDIAIKNHVFEEAKRKEEVMKRKDRLKSAVKSDHQFSKWLANLMWQEEEDEIAQIMQPEPVKERKVLPRFFKYWETEEPKKVEKTDQDKEMDVLWTEMDLLLNNYRTGSSAHVCEEEEVLGRCPKGKHRLVLKEEIGLVCSICSYVDTEITAMDPSSFEKATPSNRRDRDNYRRPSDDLDMNSDDDDNEKEGRSAEPFAETGTVWDLVPRNIRSSLFPHQKEGFEFMWQNAGGSINLEELRSSSAEDVGGGCIISHAPGTGKTRLTLVFLKAYTQLYPKSCPLVIAPAGMLRTWEEEFQKCKIDIPFHNLSNDEFSMKEKHELLKLVSEHSNLKTKESVRLVKLYSWSKTTSVLGISYTLFVKLVGCNSHLVKLLEKPGIVVLDEGHTPRNGDSGVWNALCKLKTKKRIILSGTPFQNNCTELQNTFKLIRPREERPVAAELDSLKRDDSERAEILKKAVSPYAHVYKGSILQKNLPGLRQCVIVLNPTEYQSKILEILPPSALTFDSEHKQALATVHPSLVLDSKLSVEEKQAIESEKERLVSCRGDPFQGAKTWFLIKFVILSMAAKEKVLIFSQYKKPLKLIKEQLCAFFNWSADLDHEVIIMSGDMEQGKRQNIIRQFNDPYSEAVVLLASTKACSEGITLVGASRVILLDVVWNPSVERQAISRAYRLGQKKLVYTYHVMLNGSTEWGRYMKQEKKQRLSEFMFSSNSADAVVGPPSSSSLLSDEEDTILDLMRSSPELEELFHKVTYHPRENNLMEKFGLVEKP